MNNYSITNHNYPFLYNSFLLPLCKFIVQGLNAASCGVFTITNIDTGRVVTMYPPESFEERPFQLTPNVSSLIEKYSDESLISWEEIEKTRVFPINKSVISTPKFAYLLPTVIE